MFLSPHPLAMVAGLALCIAAGEIPQSQGDTLTVTKKETKIRSEKRLFAPGVADLHEGDKVTLNSKDGAWCNVTWQSVTGWLHESDVSAKKDVRLSGQGVRESYSASETAAARKGFNPQVEEQYRKQNPDLGPAFQKVDTIQARKVQEEDVAKFLRQGGLLEESKQ